MSLVVTADVVYLASRFLSEGEPARVSLFDRGYLLGDSVFASLRIVDGSPFALSMHLARFTAAAAGMGLDVPPVEELDRIAREACARFGGASGYMRITASRGEGGPGLTPTEGVPACLSVVVRALTMAPFPSPTPAYVCSLRHPPAACLDPSWKVGSYAARVAMRREAEAREAREAIVLGVDGEVVSGIASNLFVLTRGAVLTPRLESGCRPGVTREVCLGLLHALGAPAREARLTRADLESADAIVFTSSLLPLLRASHFEGRALAGSTLVDELATAYARAAFGAERS